MMRQRIHYWSCSRFADWVRGAPKGGAKTAKEWDAWHRMSKKTHPTRYWIAETALDSIQNFIYLPIDIYDEIRYYISNRFTVRTHTLTSNLERGKWYEFDRRLLHCLFDELVNFVEIEQAYHYLAWNADERKKYNLPSRFVRTFTQWRCPEAGIKYLEWASTLTDEEWLDEDSKHLSKPTDQALAAIETLELYKWWKEIYPNRPDKYEVSGWHELCESRRERSKDNDDSHLFFLEGDQSEEDQQKTKLALDAMNDIELKYEQEDTEMLIRLIKIRKSLWT